MTTLRIVAPDLPKELEWVCSVIFSDHLGINYTLEIADVDNFRLFLDHGSVELPNVFFALALERWLDPSSLPISPLAVWDSHASGLNPSLVESRIPVIYGSVKRLSANNDPDIYLPIDIFGSIFFMLSRYEEAVCRDRDAHDRFPATASLAYRDGFLDRPIVDEYIEILWSAMKTLLPRLERKQRTARTLISCDLDLPFDPACASAYRLGRRLLGRTWREKSLRSAPETIANYLAVGRGDYSCDPYRSAIDWIMDINERAGNQVAFYFIPEQTDQKNDTADSVEEPRMRTIMRSIHVRGHEIGIHPGYNTYKHPANFAQSVNTLRRVMHEEGIQQEVLGGRQHYLRWETPTTARLWEENGLAYDTTLSYADRSGFRCGTCHEYRMYDLLNRTPLNLLQRPLVVMERSIIASKLMGFGFGNTALEMMQRYKRICHQFDGDFTLLWHNSFFENDTSKEMCMEIIN